MKRAYIAALLVICTQLVWAQGACKQDIALTKAGQPAAGAVIRVCQQGATGIPCNTLATIYRDAALTSQIIGSVFNADQQGNYAFCAPSGYYKVQVSYQGATRTDTDVTLASPTTGNGVATSLRGTPISNTGPLTGQWLVFDGVNAAWQSKWIKDVRDFNGATLDVQAHNCLLALQAIGGGTCTAEGIHGAQTFSGTHIYSGISVPTLLVFGQVNIAASGVPATSWVMSPPSNSFIRGCGKGCSVIRQKDAIGASVRMIQVQNGASNIDIQGLDLDGNKTNNPGGGVQNHAIVFDNNDRVSVSHNFIHDFNGDGVYLGSSGPLPQSWDISGITGSGAAASVVTVEATSLQVGDKFCVIHSVTAIFTSAGYDGCYTVATRADSQHFTFATANTAIVASGIITPQNYLNETVATADGVQLQFPFDFAHGQIVPGTIVLTDAGGNKYVDDQLGAISGTHMNAIVDYATGNVFVQFDAGHAPIAGAITANYSAGAQGFTSRFAVEFNEFTNMGRTPVSVISARMGRINYNFIYEAWPFDAIHWEPDSGSEWGRNIEVTGDHIYLPGMAAYSIIVGAQSDGLENSGYNNVHHNTLVGGGIQVARAPYTNISGNVIDKATEPNVIATRGHDYTIIGNVINGFDTSMPYDSNSTAILVTGTNLADASGKARGTGNNVVCNNKVSGVPVTGIGSYNSANNVICSNSVGNIIPVAPFARGIVVGSDSASLGLAKNNLVIGNRVYDDQTVKTLKTGIYIATDSTGMVVSNNLATDATVTNYLDDVADTVWWENPGKANNTNVEVTAPNYVSTVAIGTQPYGATSTTLNTNLNADMVDGNHASTTPATSTVPSTGGSTTIPNGFVNFAAPGNIGSGTAGTGIFTTLAGQTLNVGTGTTINKLYIVSGAITPAVTNANTCAEQTFTPAAFNGVINAGDYISITASATMAASGVFPIEGIRAVANGVAITYCNSTAGNLTAPAVTITVKGAR